MKFSHFLRILGIVLLAISAAFTLLGGIGTTCVAFNAENFGASMAKLAPVKPIFQLLVVISIAAALFGGYTTYRLARGKRGAYLWALIFLVIAGLASAIQFYYSLTLRGSTAPNNIRLYTTILTLVVFLIFRLPGVWQQIGYESGQGNVGSMAKPGGLALFLCGLLALTMPIWGAPTHVIDGVNTINVLLAPLMIVGAALSATGLILLSGARWPQILRYKVKRIG
jgi:hypothetical protein